MKIKELFKKDIERSIQGVIVIDEKEETKVEQELDEFVVTSELEHYLDDFFSAFNHSFAGPTDKMGVWISGFFGSGKSHFLKILSYILDSDMVVAGKRPLDYFQDKIKSNAIFQKLQAAGEHPNDVILFNIDSKSGSDTKQQKLAVVKVFNKVFNEYRGYSPAVPWMAQLEEVLDENGQYEAFKRTFEEKAGLSWEDGRDEVFYNEDYIVEALVETTDRSEESARRWIENGEDNYDISVEAFAKRIKKYVDQQPKDFRLIFMADEMGQYISDNKELMLELQTVVEDLGRFTKGKVWVVVTSQESLVSLENDTDSSKDFSKIQGRFATRLNLSSANADEVIKKRLLDKNETAKETLEIVYDERTQAMLRNKISFSNTATLKKFDEPEYFYDFYPIVPYQVTLLQKVLKEILKHGLAGSNVSTGERNLLGTIQTAILAYKDEEVGALIPFQAFYANLNQSLDYSVRSTIIQAQSNASLNEFDVEVLRLLFLIRHIEEVPSNIENVTTLMLTTIDEDRLALKEKVKASLERLVREYLVQRNLDEYTFLTNEEQDINREIISMEVPTANLQNQLADMIFSDILDMKKFTYYPFDDKKSINYTFDLSRWIDDRVIGSANAEMGVRIITDYADNYQNPELLLQLSSRENQVIVELDTSGTFYEDLLIIMKTDQYLRTYSSRKRTDQEQDILYRKTRERSELSTSIQIQLKTALQNAHIYVYGTEIDTKSYANPNLTIEAGLKQLVTNIYPNINYVHKSYRRDDFADIIREDPGFDEIEASDFNFLATEEILRYIQRQSERKITMTLWNILQEFSKRPFGWHIDDILVSIIRLIKAEKILLKSNQNIVNVNDSMFERQICNRDSQERIIVEQRKILDERIIRAAKQVTKDLFGGTPIAVKEDELMTDIREQFVKLTNKLQALKAHYRDRYYPGETEINQYLEDIHKVLKYTSTHAFFAALVDEADNLRDDHDEYLDVSNFFEYSRNAFDEAYKLNKRFKEDQSMIQYVETRVAGETIEEIIKMSHPYTRLKELPELIKQYKEWLNQEVEREAEPVMTELKEKRDILMQTIQSDDEIKQQFGQTIRNVFLTLEKKVEQATTLKDISSAKSEVDYSKKRLSDQINHMQAELEEERRRAMEKLERERETVNEPAKPVKKEPVPKLIEISKVIPPSHYKIQNEAELDEFVAKLHRQLKAELTDNQYIQFI